MTGYGIAAGMVGVAGIAACLYMAERGYEWWQILLMAMFAMCLAPNYTEKRTYKEEE